MSCANIVHNNSPSGGGVIFANGAGSKKMMHCIFMNNQNKLFYVNSGSSLEVSHSFIDHPSGSLSGGVAVSMINQSIAANTYQMQHFNSYHCNADIPLITPLESPFETPIQTLNPTNNNAETDNDNQGIFITILIISIVIVLIVVGIFFSLKYMWFSDNNSDKHSDEKPETKTADQKAEEACRV